MKKWLAILLSVLCTVSLVSCAEQIWDVGNTTAPDPSTQTPGDNGYIVTANYDYGMHRPGLATMLYDSSTLFFNLPDGYDFVVAGDEFTVTYTGQLLIQESYPSTVVITGGEIIGVTAEPAVIQAMRYNAADQSLTLLDENGGDAGFEGGLVHPDYYIIDGEGHYAELSSLTEDTILYGSISYTNRTSDGAGGITP
jgi:hypothetical protein